MSVRTGTPTRGLHLGQHLQARVEAGPAVRVDRRAVGLVEGRLEDVRHAAPPGDLRDGAAELDGVRLALDDARPADEDERVPAADGDGPDGDRMHGASL